MLIGQFVFGFTVNKYHHLHNYHRELENVETQYYFTDHVP